MKTYTETLLAVKDALSKEGVVEDTIKWMEQHVMDGEERAQNECIRIAEKYEHARLNWRAEMMLRAVARLVLDATATG